MSEYVDVAAGNNAGKGRSNQPGNVEAGTRQESSLLKSCAGQLLCRAHCKELRLKLGINFSSIEIIIRSAIMAALLSTHLEKSDQFLHLPSSIVRDQFQVLKVLQRKITLLHFPRS